jgi:hypothetical protein
VQVMAKMTEKQIVTDFVEFLAEHPDGIVASKRDVAYTYSTLRKSIIKTLQMAYEKGLNEAKEQEDFDKTLVSNKNDW